MEKFYLYDEYKTSTGKIDKRKLKVIRCDNCGEFIGVAIFQGIIIGNILTSGSIDCKCGKQTIWHNGDGKVRQHGTGINVDASALTNLINYIQKTKYGQK